ncbi:hypothetical protein [Nonomuraea endophytica]|uniref:Uncharacterized protein n=1 Tax=Nonomuraea endophytica TaxID=714136 RepID=A0A7W8A7A9_9ACTN|nr:hypothetical protein [Nonomuraea endophytica]MBB5079533.1 hypothetical protein [Nonomuraea endophytica]
MPEVDHRLQVICAVTLVRGVEEGARVMPGLLLIGGWPVANATRSCAS